MCGLVGMISHSNGFFKADTDAFKSMLLTNSMRGMDSTGVFGVDKNKRVDHMKVLGGPSFLFDHSMHEKFFSRMMMKHIATFGHGRFATQGEVDIKNAHPFQVDNITLIHNGTLTNFQALQKRHKLEHIDVDSHLCAHLFAKMSPEEVIKEISGAYAFIWYDAYKNNIGVMRNHERPLYLYERNDRKIWYFSSDDSAFKYIEHKHNFKGTIYTIDTGTYFQFSLEDFKMIKSPLYQTYRSPTSTGGTNSGFSSQAPANNEDAPRAITVISGHPLLRVGATTKFWIETEKLLNKAGKMWAISGNHDAATNIETFCFWQGEKLSANDYEMWGKIDKIWYYPSKQVYRLIIQNPTLINPEPEKEVTKTPDLVHFLGGVTRSREEAAAILKEGCKYCVTKPIKQKNAHLTAIDMDNKAVCLHCRAHLENENRASVH